jgi:hypothetical protein
MSLRKIILVPFLPMALAGCNESIDTVKNARMKVNEQYTVDQAFSNRKVCNSVDWDVITDDRNRELVQYKCHFKGIESYHENGRQQLRAQLLETFDMQRRSAQVHLEPAQMEVEAAEQALNSPRTTSSAPLDSSHLSYLLSLEQALDETPPSRSLQNYSADSIVGAVAEPARRYFLGYVRDPASAGFAAHKQNEQALLQAIEATRPGLQAAIEEERTRLRDIQQVRQQESSDYAQQRLERARALLDQLQKTADITLAELEVQHAEKLRQFDNASPIKSVAEVFQWVVKGDHIELVWSGLEGTYKDGTVKMFSHAYRPGSLNDVYKNTVQTYEELRQKAPL